MFHLRHPFFNPVWRRAAVVLATALWGLVELVWGGEIFWTLVFWGLSAVSAWVFFFDWQDLPDPSAPPDPLTPPAPSAPPELGDPDDNDL